MKRPVAPTYEATTEILGISLAHYAAVRAAVAEGFSLEEVVAMEGIAKGAFTHADLGWKQRLAQDGHLLAVYAEELAQAEDRLGRTVEPLTDDVAAWASFLVMYEAHPAPFELLDTHGLGMNDIARLRRGWAQRAERDPKLAQRIAEHRAKPCNPGPLHVGPRVLRPSKWAKSKRDAPEEGGPGRGAAVQAQQLELGLDEYAALCAEIEAMPDQRESLLKRYGLTDGEAHAELERRWRAVLAVDPAMARDFRSLRDHHARRLEVIAAHARSVAVAEVVTSPAVETPLPVGDARAASPPMSAGPAALAGTSPVLEVVLRGAALPFMPAESGTVVAEAKPGHPRAAESLTGTASVLNIPRAPELPFQGAASMPEAQCRPSAVASTSPMLDIPRGPELPFVSGLQDEGLARALSAQVPPPGPRSAPVGLVETSRAVDVPRGPALPFGPAAPGAPAGAAPPASEPARAPPALQGTSPVLELPRGEVLPFAAGAKPTSMSAPLAPARSRSAEALGETSLNLNIPRDLLQAAARASATEAPRAAPQSASDPTSSLLSLEQYAALCAELAVFPAAAESIFQRYGLADRQKRSAVDAGWKERFVREPLRYREWQELYLRYYTHWVRRGAPML